MKIYYSKIEDTIIPVNTEFSVEEDGERISVKHFQGELIKADDVYVLNGAMDAELHCFCDSCGGAAVVSEHVKVLVTVNPGDKPLAGAEHEISDEEGDEYYTGSEYMDLDDILRQEAMLAFPSKRLCGKNCAGSSYEEEESEQPFSALKKLLKEK